ncbi:MAG: [protein-PII] uridylyltransferase [Alphaproteobacteria bacterium]|nr:[protein-PII] uridylyltransferase [Alphaproteobacteria bacterium]
MNNKKILSYQDALGKQYLKKIFAKRNICKLLDESLQSKNFIFSLKNYLTIINTEIKKLFFEKKINGSAAIYIHAYKIDYLILYILKIAEQRFNKNNIKTINSNLIVIAVGGYGRSELAPFSDIDLFFITHGKQDNFCKEFIKIILYTLWDIGLKISHFVGSEDEYFIKAKTDFVLRTTFLHNRYLWGNKVFYKKFLKNFVTNYTNESKLIFIQEKHLERENKNLSIKLSYHYLQPNVKEIKGGLRDLQRILWIAEWFYKIKYLDKLQEKLLLNEAEIILYKKSYNFLWTIRCYLHYVANHAEDRLLFNWQQDIANYLGYKTTKKTTAVKKFMKDFFLLVYKTENLFDIFNATLETTYKLKFLSENLSFGLFQRKINQFYIDGKYLGIDPEDILIKNPIMLWELFLTAHEHNLKVHPRNLRFLMENFTKIKRRNSQDKQIKNLFLNILTSKKSPNKTLKLLTVTGILSKFIPEFYNAVGQMQYDTYHHYTVDEHTLKAIDILQKIMIGNFQRSEPLVTELASKISLRRVLYLAVFLHDIAKGYQKDHSEMGADIAQTLGPTFGFSASETEILVWLVRYHLLMSNIAFKRDIDQPETIIHFASFVQSLEKLRLLFILTVVDISAVGPNVWNTWKYDLLSTLYYRTELYLTGGFINQHLNLKKMLNNLDVIDGLNFLKKEKEYIEYFINNIPDAYWLSLSKDMFKKHLPVFIKACQNSHQITVEKFIDKLKDVTEIMICASDCQGFFARVAGIIASLGASVVEARIFTLANGMVFDIFSIQDAEGKVFDHPDRLNRILQSLEKFDESSFKMLPTKSFHNSLLKAQKLFTIEAGVFIDNETHILHTIVEVTASDRPGLLYALTSTITNLNLQIVHAKIATYGTRAVDVFYLKDHFGLKIEDKLRLDSLYAHLHQAIIGME